MLISLFMWYLLCDESKRAEKSYKSDLAKKSDRYSWYQSTSFLLIVGYVPMQEEMARRGRPIRRSHSDPHSIAAAAMMIGGGPGLGFGAPPPIQQGPPASQVQGGAPPPANQEELAATASGAQGNAIGGNPLDPPSEVPHEDEQHSSGSYSILGGGHGHTSAAGHGAFPGGLQLTPELVAMFQAAYNSGAEHAAANQGPAQRVVSLKSCVKDLSTLGCQPFKGGRNGEAAHDWILKAESAVKTASIPDPYCVKAVATFLSGEALAWWETEKRREGPTKQYSWEEFRARYDEHYFTKEWIRTKEAEFTNLVQGNMTVSAYEERFHRLLVYGERLCPTEQDRVEKFVRGLRPELLMVVAGLRASGAKLSVILDTARSCEAAQRGSNPMPPPKTRSNIPGPSKGGAPQPSPSRKRSFGTFSRGATQSARGPREYGYCQLCE